MKTSEQVKYISRQFNRASGKLLQDVQVKETAKTVHLTGIYRHKSKKRVVNLYNRRKARKGGHNPPKTDKRTGPGL
jgi:hypothetical protein